MACGGIPPTSSRCGPRWAGVGRQVAVVLAARRLAPAPAMAADPSPNSSATTRTCSTRRAAAPPNPSASRCFRGVATALRRADGSLLVVLDDAHDAEPAAPLLLRFLVGALERAVLESVRAAGGIGVSGGEAVYGVQAIAAVILSRRQTPIVSVSVSGVDLGEQIDTESRLASTLRRAAGAIGQVIP